jgi:RHS repeat-associated protein
MTSLSYDSQSVDGQTPTTNAQSSWVGDGWDTPDSYIEQTFATCSDNPDNLATAPTNGDECYDGPILTLSLNGSSTSLVCNSAETSCTEQADDGAVVTHETDTGNGSGTYNTDYWKITDRDGTTYYFGLNELPGYVASDSNDHKTNSVDYEPVYSEQVGEPCYSSSGLSSSVCTMAYRWHLDYVTNATGQAMSYYYTQTSNEYGEFNGAKDVSYISDSYLSEIDYGFAAGGAYGTFPDRVVFTPSTDGRCLQSSCTALTSSSMTAALAATDDPDVPYDLMCPSATEKTCTSYSPSFFSVNRLSTIETYQYSTANSAYEPVDLYTLTQEEPTTGDNTNATLWLETVSHQGLDSSAGASGSTTPTTIETFRGTELANRVDDADYPALYRYRLTSIISPLGADTTISYSTPETCSDSYVTDETAADAQTNTESCFPVYWTPVSTELLDWFNSYAVSQVLVEDTTGGSMTEETDYNYTSAGGAAWHYDDNEAVKAKYRTYGQFRGYGTVITYTGTLLNDPQTEQVDTYYRGMDGDWSIASGGTVSANVTDSLGGVHTDSDALSGDVLETRQYLGSGGPLENDAITSYWVSSAVQTRTRPGMDALEAQMSGVAEVWKSQTDSDGGETGVSTVTETDTTYDATTTDADFGLPTYSYTHTVPVNAAYDSCTSTEYAPANTSLNIVGLVSYTETDQVACSGFTEGSPSTAPSSLNTLGAPASVSASQVSAATEDFYDDPSFNTTFPQTTAPTKGLSTMVRQAVSGTPGDFTWQTVKQDTYDSYGRVQDAYDGDGNETVTAYAVNSVGLTTGETTTDPTVDGVTHTTSETLDPTRDLTLTSTDENGLVATETYDALGRLIDVWEDGRSSTLSPSLEYSYTVSNTGISGETTQTLNDAGVYNTSVTIDDSLGRVRQTQTPTSSPSGGRLITDTLYDSRGWVLYTNNDYWDSSTTPTMALDTANDSDTDQVPNQDDYVYDGLGRVVQDVSEDDGQTVSTTTTVYNGNETTVFPPSGGTVQTTVTDPLGRASKLIEYTTDPALNVPSSTFNGTFTISGGTPVTTTYGYDAQGEQNSTTDNADDTWTQTYNLLGEETSSTDPDAGASTMQYDADGNLLQTQDADGNYTSYTYDALGRKTAEYDAPTSGQQAYASSTDPGNEVAAWGYDNANDAVSGMTDAIGETTTQTSYSGGNAYVEQALGFNNFGESLGEEVTIPSVQGSLLAKTWKFTETYSATLGLATDTVFPAGGGLPAETTVEAYTTGLDLPSTLGSTLAGYGQGTTYTAYGQVEQDDIGDGATAGDATVADTYDPHTGALQQQLVTRSGTTPADVDQVNYIYDPDGLTTSETDTRLGATSTAETQCFTYTAQDQLSQAWTATDDCAATPTSTSHATVGDDLSAASAYDESWTYNSAGDQASETQYSIATGETQTTTDAYNGNATGSQSQPTTLTSTSTSTSGSSSTSGTAYGYNADGEQTTRETATGDQMLSWGNQGQLSGVTNSTSGTDSSYIYDANGNLLLETDGGDTTLYLPSEQITVDDSADTIVSAARYYTLPGGITVVRTGLGSDYDFEIASDQHGTNTLFLDSTAQDPTWRQYDPYGNPRGTTTTWIDNRGFLDDPDDTATALTDVGARWYDPTTGSFISLDPVLETGDPTQLGGYDYSGNDPASTSDPTGDMPTGCTGSSCGGNPASPPHDCSNDPSMAGCPTGSTGGDGNSNSNNTSTNSTTTVEQADSQLAADEAAQTKLDQVIAATEAFIKEQQRLQAMEAEPCSGVAFRLGACPAEEAGVGQMASACAGSAGWGCLLMGVSTVIPLGEIADALGISDLAVSAGSKALDAVAPGLSDALADGLAGAQDILNSLIGKASQLASKILGDETDLAKATPGWRDSFNALADGKQVGTVKIVDNTANLRTLFDEWTAGAKQLSARGAKIPDVYELNDGTVIQWRLASQSGGETIDIFPSEGRPLKVHLS